MALAHPSIRHSACVHMCVGVCTGSKRVAWLRAGCCELLSFPHTVQQGQWGGSHSPAGARVQGQSRQSCVEAGSESTLRHMAGASQGP